MLCQENLLHIILYICTNSPIVSICIIPRVICFMHIYKYLWLDILKDHMAVYKFLSFNDIYIDCDCRYIEFSFIILFYIYFILTFHASFCIWLYFLPCLSSFGLGVCVSLIQSFPVFVERLYFLLINMSYFYYFNGYPSFLFTF